MSAALPLSRGEQQVWLRSGLTYVEEGSSSPPLHLSVGLTTLSHKNGQLVEESNLIVR